MKLHECAKVFVGLGIPRATFYRIAKNIRSRQTITNYQNSGRDPYKMTTSKLCQSSQVADGWNGSQRKLANKFGISVSYCHELLDKKGIRSFKKVDCPKSTPEQRERQMERLNTMITEMLPLNGKKDLIEDDESYFSLSGKLNNHYLSSDRSKIDEKIKFKPRSKFEKRLMVWMAISPRGCSKPYFAPANCAINAEIYRKECITKRLVPFIKKFYPKGRYLFWPDGASSHYAAVTIATLTKFGLNFVPKERNPPNVPQLRSIERFRAHLKQKVYENRWETDNFDSEKLESNLKSRDFIPIIFVVYLPLKRFEYI